MSAFDLVEEINKAEFFITFESFKTVVTPDFTGE